jgi:hypothetical protein
MENKTPEGVEEIKVWVMEVVKIIKVHHTHL